ncbi:helix-turn-helix transcriptional regulator [Kribbella sp. NBC_01505]|uniref:helix-turn-helix domain-containing protein n=1 Tax=Kribbella sp. NBC_01505 TaxID=2903580 RepID=UPI003863B3EE
MLRSLRRRRGMTQQQLVDLSTVSMRSIRDIERGRTRRPHPGTVQLLANALGLSGPTRVGFETSAVYLPAVEEPGPARVGTAGPVALAEPMRQQVEIVVVGEMPDSRDRRLVTVAGRSGVSAANLASVVARILHDSGRFLLLDSGSVEADGYEHRTALLVVRDGRQCRGSQQVQSFDRRDCS